jgi:hypothetical protein
MTPEIAIDRVRSFIRWNGEKLEHLDAGHEAIANPVGWRRGAEYWVPPATWHDIFENDEDAAVFGAQTLRDNGLLRIQSGQVSLQCCVKIRKEVKHCYCVSEKILAWAPSTSGTRPAKIGPQYGGTSLNSVSPPLNSLQPSDGQAPALSALLSDGTRLALMRAVEVLATSPDPR